MEVQQGEKELIAGFTAVISSLVFYLRENELLDYEKLAMVCAVQLEELQRLGAPERQRYPLRALLGFLHSEHQP